MWSTTISMWRMEELNMPGYWIEINIEEKEMPKDLLDNLNKIAPLSLNADDLLEGYVHKNIYENDIEAFEIAGKYSDIIEEKLGVNNKTTVTIFITDNLEDLKSKCKLPRCHKCHTLGRNIL